MSQRTRSQRTRVERYEAERSPLAQGLTQQELARLLGMKRGALRGLAFHKNEYIIRRSVEINNKQRNLAYPRGKLRSTHEKLKYILKRIKLPNYVYSPRVGRAQRDNAIHHVGQIQFLKFDLKQFYPSTKESHVRAWAVHLGMKPDVAKLFADIATVDGVVSFGSPATPALVNLVHRKMFDEIDRRCVRRGLKMSLWVDDVVISGKFVPGTFLEEIRGIVRKNGLKSHKFEYWTGARRVPITGVPVNGLKLDAPRSLHDKIRAGYGKLHSATDAEQYHSASDRLLSNLGTYRYLVGRQSDLGRRAAGRMNTLRQRRGRVPLVAVTLSHRADPSTLAVRDDLTAPF